MTRKKETNKELILGSLLKSPKTTGQLASELNYFDSKGIPDYGIIFKDLERLLKSRYIENKKDNLNNHGRIPTLYSILFNIQNLRNILKEFPNLIENMQRSELALETIIQENFSWINNSTEEEYVEIEKLNALKKIGKESWKEKLRLSPEFFRFCLNTDYIDMMERVRKLTRVSSEYWESTAYEFNTTQTSSVYLWETNYRIETIFKACVISDISQGQVKEEAIEYLQQRKNRVLDEQIERLKEYYRSTKVAPEFIRGKEFTPVENSKLRELEQGFINIGGKFI